MSSKPKILVVEDDAFNLDILRFHLLRAGYDVIPAGDGLIALERLREHPDVEVIVLDRMMPNMDGMRFFLMIKDDPSYRHIPVVMQTAAALAEQVIDGINAGVYYYLTKPYEQQTLLAIVGCAVQDARTRQHLEKEVLRRTPIPGLMQKSVFHFRTIQEASNLAFYIANCLPHPSKAIFGLHQLLVNAVEHGNLGIGYGEKTALILSGALNEEIQRRLSANDNAGKFAQLHFEQENGCASVLIKDQGSGFDWRQYIQISPDRVCDPHGRSIALAREYSLSELEYIGDGNAVLCKFRVPQEGAVRKIGEQWPHHSASSG
jgi:CheY-like chemotaxis protein